MPIIPTLLKPGVVEFVVSIFWKYLLISSFPVRAGMLEVPIILFMSKLLVVVLVPGIFVKYLL